MNRNNLSYPYPVLGINDDVAPALGTDQVSFDKPLSDAEYFTFTVHLRQHNKTISDLIAEGKAEYMVEVNCSSTLYKHCFSSPEPDLTFRIGRRTIAGRIVLSSCVVVKDKFDYVNDDFNEDYDGITFPMEPGDILVLFNDGAYNLDIKYDKLYAAGSYMQIEEDPNPEHVYPWFDLNQDKIMITLPHAMYEQYSQFIHNDLSYMEIVHSSLVYNALVYALLNFDEDMYKDRMWHDCINYRIKTEKDLNEFDTLNDYIDKEMVYELAQKLLGNPYQRMFNHLQQLKENSQEEE